MTSNIGTELFGTTDNAETVRSEVCAQLQHRAECFFSLPAECFGKLDILLVGAPCPGRNYR